MNSRPQFFIRSLVGCALVLATAFWMPSRAEAQQRFKDLLGSVSVGEVKPGTAVQVPYITWGGDVATFDANGGLTTTPESIYGKLGLKLKLVPGDDFVGQVKQYLQGESPFLRGTMRMLGQASEAVGSDPRTKPVVLLQMTWSAGDHMVSRGAVKTLNDLKGKKVALQQGGPHVGMLDDILAAASLKWSDIQVVWTDELTGPKGPAELFRKEPSVDACMVISPDMIGITGGLEGRGTGAEGTVKDAGVLISTATMTRSIADVYACRKDYFDANRPMIEKFVAGYLKACEEIVPLKQAFEKTGSSPRPYLVVFIVVINSRLPLLLIFIAAAYASAAALLLSQNGAHSNPRPLPLVSRRGRRRLLELGTRGWRGHHDARRRHRDHRKHLHLRVLLPRPQLDSRWRRSRRGR